LSFPEVGVNSRYGLVDRESWQPFFTLLLFCGIGLLLTIPTARLICDFDRIAFLPGVPIFFHAYALFLGIFGLNIGATSAARKERGRALVVLLAGRILVTQALSLPYFVFAWALYPGEEAAFAAIILYMSVVSLLCATTARLIEQPDRRNAPRGFLLKYGLFAIYYALPLLGVPAVSPITAVAQILAGQSLGSLIVAFAVPAALLAGCWLLLQRRLGDERGV